MQDKRIFAGLCIVKAFYAQRGAQREGRILVNLEAVRKGRWEGGEAGARVCIAPWVLERAAAIKRGTWSCRPRGLRLISEQPTCSDA